WTFLGPSTHSVTESSGLALFDSGPHGFVSTFSVLALSAGTFVYRDGAALAKDAAINVPVALPPGAFVGTPFPVTWSHVRGAHGLVFDVQVREPGSAVFTNLTSTSSPSGSFTASAPGVHQFRARVRDPLSNKATLFSLPSSVLVQ